MMRSGLSIRRVAGAARLSYGGVAMGANTVNSMAGGLSALTLTVFLWLTPVLGADRIRIGVSNYSISNLTVGVAHTRGFFAQEGIDAEIIRMNPNVATMALVSGDIDYSTLIGSLIGADLRGAKLKMIACSQDRTPLSIVGNATLKAIKDIRGKTIGVGSYGSTPDMIARLIAKHFGIDPETEIKMLALGSDGARLTALKEGAVDAIIVSPPVDFEAKKLGFNVLSRAGDVLRFP